MAISNIDLELCPDKQLPFRTHLALMTGNKDSSRSLQFFGIILGQCVQTLVVCNWLLLAAISWLRYHKLAYSIMVMIGISVNESGM